MWQYFYINVKWRIMVVHKTQSATVCARACMWVYVCKCEWETEWERERECAYSPLHYNQQTLSALIEVLVDVDDSHNVGTRWGPPVELHFPAGLGAVLQHLGEKKETRQELRRVWGILRLMRLKRKSVNCKNKKKTKKNKNFKDEWPGTQWSICLISK